MSGSDTLKHRAKLFVQGLPGRKESLGGGIPDHIHAEILQAARGITLPLWGRHPTPQQIQDLYDQGAHTAEQVHGAYSTLPHPHAPSLTVGEYPQYEQSYKLWQKHR